MAAALDQALLLRRIPFRESSLVLHLLTREHGRIALLAKGARRSGSRMRPHLTQLAPLTIRWIGGTRGMGTLTEATRGAELLPPTHHLQGLEILALAARLFREGDHHGFAETAAAIARLAAFPQAEAGAVAATLLLLQQAGLIDHLDRCWRCAESESTLRWIARHCLCPRCAGRQQGATIPSALRRPLASDPPQWDDATITLGRRIVAELQQQVASQGAH